MQLVYLSPLPWTSFAQRPHKFVEWFHTRTGGQVLWVDPYPTRLPVLSDLRRIAGPLDDITTTTPEWLRVRRPRSLPIEPVPGGPFVNRWFFRSLLIDIGAFSLRAETMLVVGKPSALAVQLSGSGMPFASRIYDVMDDFAAFYSGASERSMSRREREMAELATTVLASSSALYARLVTDHPDTVLLRNGLDPKVLPPRRGFEPSTGRRLLGYVGTIGRWFDWEWIAQLARARPEDVVRLIGPRYSEPDVPMPINVEILPAVEHAEALLLMRDFDVALIPFRLNRLTASVDPIKYYEYRALGLPVISTGFGEMAFRAGEDGTYIATADTLAATVAAALAYRPRDELIAQFVSQNSWHTRFDSAGLI